MFDYAVSAAAFFFLRQPSKPKPPRPDAKSGRAAGNGVAKLVKVMIGVENSTTQSPQATPLISTLSLGQINCALPIEGQTLGGLLMSCTAPVGANHAFAVALELLRLPVQSTVFVTKLWLPFLHLKVLSLNENDPSNMSGCDPSVANI